MSAFPAALQADFPAFRVLLRALGETRLIDSKSEASRIEPGQAALMACRGSVRSWRCLFVTVHGAASLPLSDFLESLHSTTVAGDALAALGEKIRHPGGEARLAMLEISAEEAEEEVDQEELRRIMGRRYRAVKADSGRPLLTLGACVGGLPPLIHLGAEGLTLPIRSWVPAGLTERWRPLCQTIECRPGDRMLLHSEARGEHSLRSFHDLLKKSPEDWTLPEGIAAGMELRFEDGAT
ncbi:MAG: hypothetical protein K1X75_08440 [Leptospirales bacterium]|nr:hypothetical protein [Leptospirales bacterium]